MKFLLEFEYTGFVIFWKACIKIHLQVYFKISWYVFRREVILSSSVYKVLDPLRSFELLMKEMENEFLKFEPVTSDPKAGIIYH